jgi:hypothetical protein
MNYSVPGELLARLLVVAGLRMDSDEIGDIVHRIRPIVEAPTEPVDADVPDKPAKPEA